MISKNRAVAACLLCMLITLMLGTFLGLLLFTGLSPSQFGLLIPQIGRLRQIGEVSTIIDRSFYKAVDDQHMFDSAAKGMLASLDDKYAAYYTAEEYERIMSEQSGKYVGIGVGIGMRDDGTIYVMFVHEDSPAERAGIRTEDTFFAIDGESVEGWTTEDLVKRIGTFDVKPYQITVMRGEEKLTFDIHNEEIVTHRVHTKSYGEVFYVRIDEFTGDCVEGFRSAIAQAKQSGAKALLIDLRGNPGGDLGKVVDIADELLNDGIVLTMRTRDGKEEVYKSHAGALDLPMAVLVNGFSASASEVLAGALQDYQVATLVGTQTYGKGIVQTVYPMLTGDGHVKLTTAVYYTPNGRSLHGTGIAPDLVVELPEEQQNVPVSALEESQDTQLEAALRVLRGQL